MSYFRNTVTTEQVAERQKQFLAALAAVDETKISVVCRNRCCRRKEQARLTRQLFKQLGLKGCFVRAPNYANAMSVEIYLPWAKGTLAAYSAVQLKVEEILARAFPQHDNRSDYMTDYFDYCWSIHSYSEKHPDGMYGGRIEYPPRPKAKSTTDDTDEVPF